MLHSTPSAGEPAATPDTLERLSPTPARWLVERDEFGPLDRAGGRFGEPLEPTGLHALEDLGHALCPWVAREHLL